MIAEQDVDLTDSGSLHQDRHIEGVQGVAVESEWNTGPLPEMPEEWYAPESEGLLPDAEFAKCMPGISVEAPQ